MEGGLMKVKSYPHWKVLQMAVDSYRLAALPPADALYCKR
jgi:hypothetical protein